LTPDRVIMDRINNEGKVTHLITTFEDVSDPLEITYENMKEAFPEFVEDYDMHYVPDDSDTD